MNTSGIQVGTQSGSRPKLGQDLLMAIDPSTHTQSSPKADMQVAYIPALSQASCCLQVLRLVVNVMFKALNVRVDPVFCLCSNAEGDRD